MENTERKLKSNPLKQYNPNFNINSGNNQKIPSISDVEGFLFIDHLPDKNKEEMKELRSKLKWMKE